MVLGYAESFAEALVVDYLSLTEEFYGIADVGVVYESEKIVIGCTRLLLCYYHVFATKSCLAKVRKILMFQGISALLKLTIFQKFQ